MRDRPTFRTRNRACDNCGFGLLSHKLQRYCPASREEAEQFASGNLEYAHTGIWTASHQTPAHTEGET